ncbi:MAG: L-threonylcarbamoyladenylate synthase [Pseudomonadota bacterium]|nr:L-threonylcarbamoyladenylate synthase [Pseudomonadota bacterium]
MPLVDLPEAARLLRDGRLVGVPTETVYGLAANALDATAVAEIFAAKGRPTDHPLIVHTLDDPDVHAFADDRARLLAATFWPGPLTLVLPKRPHVPGAVTGGHATVAVRSPAHPLARALLRLSGLPFAAPSANRFGGLSPTTAEHVLTAFPELPVLDGGRCPVGVESTIVDLTGPVAAVLRPGGVPIEALEAILGPLARTSRTAAPGTLAAHYAPRAALVATAEPDAEAARHRALGLRVEILRALPSEQYAHALYEALRALDARGADVIVAEWAEPGGLGDAVNDRLRRAAATKEPHGTA